MTQPANNLRVRRTQKLLREALIDMIEERGFEALTIGEITDRAMVSRAAFYRNYKDKYDLVEQIFEEAMNTLLNAVGDFAGPEHSTGTGDQKQQRWQALVGDLAGPEYPAEVWVKFFEHIAEYERLYRALLGKKGSLWFVSKMRVSLLNMVVKAHGPAPSGQPTVGRPIFTSSDELVPDLVSAMFVEAITWWLEQGRPYTPREMAKRCALLASALFKELSPCH